MKSTIRRNALRLLSPYTRYTSENKKARVAEIVSLREVYFRLDSDLRRNDEYGEVAFLRSLGQGCAATVSTATSTSPDVLPYQHNVHLRR